MKRITSIVLCGSAALIFSLAAQAQTYGPGPYGRQQVDPYYGNDPNYRNYPDRGGYNNDDRYSQQRGYYPDQGRYGYDRYGYGGNPGPLIGRVLADLDRAGENARFDGHERKHFEKAARQLEQFEDRRRQGKFDNGKIHAAIGELDHLVRADRVNRRDRQILARDREDLRQFSFSRGRYSNYGYRDNRDDRYNQNRRYDPNWR